MWRKALSITAVVFNVVMFAFMAIGLGLEITEKGGVPAPQTTAQAMEMHISTLIVVPILMVLVAINVLAIAFGARWNLGAERGAAVSQIFN